jgi:glycosyltransferase involved in cell wall biosynthesis
VPKRVVYFTDGAVFGGAEQILIGLLGGLDRTHWVPYLVHHREPGMAPLVEQARGLGVVLHEVPRTQGQPSNSRWAHLVDLVRYLRAERPDVFHAHLTWPLACKYGLLAAILARVPAIVATAHCYITVPWRNGVYLQQAISLGVGRYVGVSRTVAEGIRRTLLLPKSKLRVIHNGIAADAFAGQAPVGLRASLTAGTERPVVLCVARLDRGKGHRFLLRAAVQIPQAIFVIAGDGPELGPLQAEARTLGIQERILFLGQRGDIPDLLASCDVFVLPSLNEGLPLSVLEAMAAGRAVVATDAGGTREAITHDETGLLVPPADAAGLSAALRRMIGDPVLAQRLSGAARARVHKDFTTARMVEGNTRVYSELLVASAGRNARG